MSNTAPKSKYIALTIGPIVKTLNNARKTRELWAASYLFSYTIKQIIAKLKAKHPNYSFILPNVEGDLAQTFLPAANRTKQIYKMGAGLFPDRIIAQVPSNTSDGLETLNVAVTDVLEDLADDMSSHIKTSVTAVLEYLQSYLQIHTLEVETDENPILILQRYLDSLELQRTYPLEEQKYLTTFFDWVTKSFLVKDAWENDYISFPTILEVAVKEFEPDNIEEIIEQHIALQKVEHAEHPMVKIRQRRLLNYHNIMRKSQSAKELRREMRRLKKEEEGAEQNLIEFLSQKYSLEKVGKAEAFQTAHKYIAIVQADGDNVGNLIEKLGEKEGKNNENLLKFSNKLSAFAAEAVELIQQYGGMPIYAGGDDLLFFAPVLNRRSKLIGAQHIFALLQQLDEQFQSRFKTFQIAPNPTLSFGLSMTYYKFPLYEALNTALFDLLKGKAKKQFGDKKNAIAFRLLKHSGSYFEAAFRIPDDNFKQFSVLLQNAIQNPDSQLSSIIYRIKENEQIFNIIGKDATQVQNYFANSFDEDIHKEKEGFLKKIVEWMPLAYESTKDAKAANQLLYSSLRTIAFLTSNNTND